MTILDELTNPRVIRAPRSNTVAAVRARRWEAAAYEVLSSQGRTLRRLGRWERKAVRAGKAREARTLEGCPSVLTFWETVPHHRYPDNVALSHRVRLGARCGKRRGHLARHAGAGRQWE